MSRNTIGINQKLLLVPTLKHLVVLKVLTVHGFIQAMILPTRNAKRFSIFCVRKEYKWMNALFDATIVQNQRVKISPRLIIVTFVHIDFVTHAWNLEHFNGTHKAMVV